MKRTICMLLASLMLLSSLAACSNNDTGTNTDTAVTDTSTTEDVVVDEEVDVAELSDYEQRQLISDDLPDADFEGKELSFVTQLDTAVCDYEAELWVEDLNGDACNDAVYQRQVKVEDRFNMKMTVATDSNPHNLPKVMATAGTADYLICCFKDYLSYNPINAGALLNWIDVPNVDLDKPWHNSLANDDATINGYLYAICSDLSVTSMTFTHTIYANLELMSTYGYSSEDLYALVKEGKWTIDTFCSMVEGMYVDTNGDGKADVNDLYGFGYSIVNPADVWFTAFGGKTLSKNEDGTLEVTFYDEKTDAMLDKLIELHWNNAGFNNLSTQYDEQEWFLNEQLVMAPMRFYAAFIALRDMESAYTMLPFPKWDEAQDAYYTNADDKFIVFGLPTTSYSEMEFIGTCFEALCAESYKQVYPAYYDTALKGKYSTDAETAEMIELIMAGRAFDFSFQFGESVFQRIPYMIRDQIAAGTNTLASKYKSIQKAMNKGIEKTFNKAYHFDE